MEQTESKVDITELLRKLDEAYDKEEEMIKQREMFRLKWEQLQEDKEMLQTMIMHQANKSQRFMEAYDKWKKLKKR